MFYLILFTQQNEGNILYSSNNLKSFSNVLSILIPNFNTKSSNPVFHFSPFMSSVLWKEHLVVIYLKVTICLKKRGNDCPCIIEFIKNWGKAIKMLAWLSILSLFYNEFNKVNTTGERILVYLSDNTKSTPFRNEFNKCHNTGARKIDFIYHMTSLLGVK